jgi:hypothetical protein
MAESSVNPIPAHGDSGLGNVLAGWYVATPRIRRACAYEIRGGGADGQSVSDIYVLLDVEPAMDSDEVLPVWLAHSGAWQVELQARTARTVHLDWLEPYETAATPHSMGDGVLLRSIGVWYSDRITEGA